MKARFWLLALVFLPVLVVFVPLLLGAEVWERVAHRWHRDGRSWCLRCVRRAVLGEDSPAGRFL